MELKEEIIKKFLREISDKNEGISREKNVKLNQPGSTENQERIVVEFMDRHTHVDFLQLRRT